MKMYRSVFLQRRTSHSLKQRNWQSPWRQQQKAVSKFKKILTYPPKEFTSLAEESFEVEGEAQEHPPCAADTPASCYRCNGAHHVSQCRFKHAVCHNCKKQGHIVSACKSKKTEVEPTTKRSHHVGEKFDYAKPEGAYSLYNISNSKAEDPIYVGLTVNGFHVMMELDTGSGLTINEENYSKIGQPNQLNPLEKASVILKTYTGQQINVLGTAQVVVWYHGREEVLPVQVVKGVGLNLLGRDWIHQLKVSVEIGCNLVGSVNSNRGDLLCKHADVFKPELGLLTEFKAKFHVKSEAIPKFLQSQNCSVCIEETC